MTGLKGGDALVLQVAEEFGVPMLTKDKEMKDKAPAGMIVFQPNEVPR